MKADDMIRGHDGALRKPDVKKNNHHAQKPDDVVEATESASLLILAFLLSKRFYFPITSTSKLSFNITGRCFKPACTGSFG